MKRELFGTLAGKPIEQFTLTNRNRVEVKAITYGGIITSLRTPDRNGTFADIVLGFDSLNGYLGDHPFFGAIVGRYCNRIAGGRFDIDGTTYQLTINNGPNHLHGGSRGFDKVIWQGEPLPSRQGQSAVVFSYTSADGEEGYPGTVAVTVTYTLTDDNELIVEYAARTDKATHVNLTQHSYFNLAGTGDVLGHELTIAADSYTPVDAMLIPTGEIAAVEGTPFDFRVPTLIGARIADAHPQITYGGGYDHNWILSRGSGDSHCAVRVHEPRSGRTLEVMTTEPGVQFYSGNSLDGRLVGTGGRRYERRSGFCLETQHYPDTPNHDNFPTTLLKRGSEYKTRTSFIFGVRSATP